MLLMLLYIILAFYTVHILFYRHIMTYNMELLIIIPSPANNLSLYFIRYYIEYIVINRCMFKALYLF